jgi:NAD(P)-dependent dehydrogenase (short-subunit alcohol dehydrogenase family)
MARTILVTGAGGGIGNAVARLFLARGDIVIASARSINQVAELSSLGAQALAMDVSSDISVSTAFLGITQLDIVVHCAAIAPLGSVEFTTPEKVAEIHNINTLGALRILQKSLPLLRQSPQGRLLLVSSLWGQLSGPLVSTYAASKHAIEALADSARRENGNRPPYISVVEPGVVKTEMFFRQIREIDDAVTRLQPQEHQIYAGIYAAHRRVISKAERSAISVDKCAQLIVHYANAPQPKPRYRIGLDARLMISLSRLLSDRALDRLFAYIYKS